MCERRSHPPGAPHPHSPLCSLHAAEAPHPVTLCREGKRPCHRCRLAAAEWLLMAGEAEMVLWERSTGPSLEAFPCPAF